MLIENRLQTLFKVLKKKLYKADQDKIKISFGG